MRFFCILLAAFLTSASAVHAQSSKADAAVDAALACRGIADSAARLACLDKATAAIAETRIIREDAADAAAAPSDADAAATKAAQQAPTTDDFGKEQLKEVRRARSAEHESRRLTATIVEARFNPYKVVTVTLDNGQVWRQLNSDDEKLFLKDGKLYTVGIKRGVMGNYLMTVNEAKRTIRVRRIQ